MTQLGFLVLVLCAIGVRPTIAQERPSETEIEAQIERITSRLVPAFQIEGKPVETTDISERMEQLGIPGLSIAIAYQGNVLWSKGYGLADIEEARQVTPGTLFLAGSISKPVAALRPLQLADKNELDLDADVNRYLKTWKLPENEFTKEQKVTLRRILNHTAGLTVWGFPGYDLGDRIPSVPEVLDGAGNTDAVRVFQEPGTGWQYSGGGYTIMQQLLTDFERRSYPELMQANVLDPLGMSKSTYENPLPKKYHAIAATGYRANGEPVEGKRPIYPEMAAAGLWTTPSQLLRYATEIQRVLKTRRDGIIKVSTALEMLKPGDNEHGLGPVSKEHTFEHGGADEGFRAMLVAWKKHDYAITVFVNSDNGTILDEIVQSAAAEYGLPGHEPSIKKPITLSKKKRSRFVGTYSIEDLTLNIALSENGIQLSRAGAGVATEFLPESEQVFFDTLNGGTIEFILENGTVTGLELKGANLVLKKTEHESKR